MRIVNNCLTRFGTTSIEHVHLYVQIKLILMKHMFMILRIEKGTYVMNIGYS